jgi:hypothetical protein
MFGLDDHIAGLGAGELFAVVALVAVLLGLRHATDPDHLAAVTTLVASDEPDPRRAGRLGFIWGLGHATSLFAFGVPIVLFESYLPDALQTAAETAVGVVIIVLALRLLRRPHHRRSARTPLQAYVITRSLRLLHSALDGRRLHHLRLRPVPRARPALLPHPRPGDGGPQPGLRPLVLPGRAERRPVRLLRRRDPLDIGV